MTTTQTSALTVPAHLTDEALTAKLAVGRGAARTARFLLTVPADRRAEATAAAAIESNMTGNLYADCVYWATNRILTAA